MRGLQVIAVDDCGNYFVNVQDRIYFWDHELGEREFLAKSLEEFLLGCVAPTEVELLPGQVESAWIDPEFAKQFGTKL